MFKRIAILWILVLFLSKAFAQEARVVQLVVPFSSGSAQDIFARLISEPLSQELHARVAVLNKPGAGGTLGAAFVAQAKPDGQTYLLAASNLHLAGALKKHLPYQPLDSFQGAAFFGYSDYVLIASSDLKTPDLASFIAMVKKHPDEFNYASAGNGSVTHVGMASFLNRAGLNMVHMPLKGTSEIINEVLSGRVQAAMVSTLSIQAYKADQRLKLLAVTHAHRSAQFADLPALAESGLPGFKWTSWAGLLAPAGTPKDKLQELNNAVNKVLSKPQMKKRLEVLGIMLSPLSVDQFDSLLRDDWRQSLGLISQLNITLD